MARKEVVEVSTEQVTKDIPARSTSHVHAQHEPGVPSPLSDPRVVEARRGPSRLTLLLLSCGIVAPLIYVATDLLLAMRWEGYSYRDQTISELNAIGAPTRTLSIVLGITGYAFLVAFGVGVWRSATGSRRLRVAAGGLIALGVFAWFGVPFFAMHVRGAEQTLTDALHVAQLAVAGPLMLGIIGFGAAAFGLRFRLYSAATVLFMFAFGAWSGTYGADIADDLETPWVGVIERISVYAYQLWLVVFAVALLAVAYGCRPAGGSRGQSSHRFTSGNAHGGF